MADLATSAVSGVLSEDQRGPAGPALGVLLAVIEFPLLAAGYRAVIESAPDLRLAGVVGCRAEVGAAAARSDADIVVTDCLPDPGAGGVAQGAMAEIRTARPAARILAIDWRAGSERCEPALRAGASGFVAREASVQEVLAALRSVGRAEPGAGVPSGAADR